MGEGGTIGAPAAIANALADALAPLGAEIFELPMTSERLFRLIEMVKKRCKESSSGSEFEGQVCSRRGAARMVLKHTTVKNGEAARAVGAHDPSWKRPLFIESKNSVPRSCTVSVRSEPA